MLTVILVQLKPGAFVFVCTLFCHSTIVCVVCVEWLRSAAAALRLVLVGAVPGQQVAFPVFICFILLSKP